MRKLIFILGILALGACSAPATLTPDELNAYLLDPDNGLVQKSEINHYNLEVVYRPTDLLVEQEVGREPVAVNKIEALRSKYGKYYYFILNLSRENKEALHQLEGGMDQYSDLVQVMSFRMGAYVNLTTQQDTIPTADFILNRTYGLSTATTLLFVFDRAKAQGKDWVQFNLNEFGLGVGNQRFRFRVKDLEGAPKVKFDILAEEKKK